MWNGVFSPDLRKRKLNYKLVSWEPANIDEGLLEEIDPGSDQAEGVLTVQFKPGGSKYSWYCSYESYQEFEQSGFDTAWLVENAPIEAAGAWGWPWGRTEGSGWWAGNSVSPKGKPAKVDKK